MQRRSPILQMEHVSKAYGGTPVLTDFTLAAMPGQLTVVYGPPAAGKSVLVRLLTGLETAGRGPHHPARSGRDARAAGRPQHRLRAAVVRALSAPLGARQHRLPARSGRRAGGGGRARWWPTPPPCSKIDEHLDKSPDQLSGGQKQRVAIARGIAKRTDFFVLDDPLAGLDFKLREQLVDDLRELKIGDRRQHPLCHVRRDRGDDARR